MSRSPRLAVPSRSALAFAVALAFCAPSAFAQDSATILDAVQVTAQRRVENIQDVPVSFTSINA